MSDINVSVLDQQLQLTSTPTVAAQGVNEDYIVFDFLDNSWSGFSMVALFFAEDNPEAVYQSVVNSAGRALVPWEATQTDGAMYFGLAGVNGNIRYTSELVRYKIVAGLYEGAESVEPTPSVYEQWAAAVSEYAANVADLTGDVAELSERLDIAEALQTDTMSGSKIVTYTSDALTAQYESALQQYYVEYAVALPAGASVLETAWSRGASDVWQQSDLRTTMSASTATVRHTLEAQSAYTFKIRVTIAYPESANLAELQDIRVGADGTVYASAGAAVRAQAMKLDSTLTEAGKAADAKATGDAIADLKDDISNLEPGLSTDARDALLNVLKHLVWLDSHANDYYEALKAELYAAGYPKITATFNPGTHKVYEGDSLDSLKPYLTVKYYADDSSAGTVVSTYTLSGDITEGTQTIYVRYSDYSASFTVTVTNPFIYRLSNTPVEFDGSTGIDTGIKLLNENRTFTIALEFTDDTPYNTEQRQSYLFGCYLPSSPYTGVFVQVYDGGDQSEGRLVRHVLRCTPPGQNGGQVIFDSVIPAAQLVGRVIRMCFRYDSTNGGVKAVLSVNGVSITPSTDTINYTFTAITANLSIGCRIGTATMAAFFKGQCNDFKVFNSALSDAEMQAYIEGVA